MMPAHLSLFFQFLFAEERMGVNYCFILRFYRLPDFEKIAILAQLF